MAGLSTDEIRDLFAQEAEIRLRQLGQLLLQLETSGDDETLVRSVFREIHTLKGSAAIAGLTEVSDCAHALEELVDDLRTGKRRPTPNDVDQLTRRRRSTRGPHPRNTDRSRESRSSARRARTARPERLGGCGTQERPSKGARVRAGGQ